VSYKVSEHNTGLYEERIQLSFVLLICIYNNSYKNVICLKYEQNIYESIKKCTKCEGRNLQILIHFHIVST